MMPTRKRKSFGRLVSSAIDDNGLSKTVIAEDLGIGLTTVYRILHGQTRIDKSIVTAIVRSINKFAGRSVLEESEAMKAAGYSSNGYHAGQDRLADLIAAHATKLPESVQEDLLAMVRALERKHQKA